jgi:hypothetical protein
MKKVIASKEVKAASRREFLKSFGGAAALSTFGIQAANAGAEGLPRLDESDQTAIALKYLHDASAVAETLRPDKDRYCFNCALYAGSETDEWAGCAIFPGKAVAGRGWCSVWAAR